MSHIKRTWYVENTWQCPSCKSSNKGRNINCQNCGARKPPDAKEQMGSPSEEVKDPELLKQAKAGPNWVCEYCGGQERNLNGECTLCGGPKEKRNFATVDNSDLNELLNKAARGPKREPIPTAQVHSYHGVEYDLPTDLKPWWRTVEGWRGWANNHPTASWVLPLVFAAMGFTVWFLIWLFTPRYVDTKVQDISWTYTSNLRERQTFHNEDWDHPGNKGFYHEPAFNVSCESRYYGTENCNPHNCNPHSESYSCNCTSYECDCHESCTNSRNGYSSCTEECETCNQCSTCYRTVYDTCYDQCPVYRDWCKYDYYDWPIQSTLQTSGNDHEVYWPKMEPNGPLQRVQKIQEYNVLFTSSDDRYLYAPSSLLEFKRFNIGDKWRLRVGKIRDHHIEGLEKR